MLPSICSRDKHYAPDDSPYIFNGDESTNTKELFDKYLPLPNDVHHSVPLPGTEMPGFSPVYRNKAFPNRLKEGPLPHMNTYHRLIQNSVKYNGDAPVFGYRKYDYATGKSENKFSTVTYNEMSRMKDGLGSGILFLLKSNPYKDLSLDAHQKIDSHEANYKNFDCDNVSFIVTIFAANRMEWVLTDIATSSYSMTNTALYDTLGPDTSQYILQLTESPIVVCSKNHIKSLIDLKHKYDLKNLIMLVSMDPLSDEEKSLVGLADKHQIKLYEFDQVIKLGQVMYIPPLEPSPETLYTISFTSGTTGSQPKGVELSQKVCCAGVTFVLTNVPHPPHTRSFSFLPLAHIFERQVAAFVLNCGGCIGFPQFDGTPLTLVEDLKLWKPTFMANVPRVFTKFEAALKAATIDSDSAVKKAIFSRVFDSKAKAQAAAEGATGKNIVYDNLLLSKLRKLLGFDNMEYVITGSAPISPATMRFLKSALNIGMPQGYGLTESFAGFSISAPYALDPSTCGATAVTTEMKLREIPEMGYLATDKGGPRGELLLRGPQVFSRYYKNPEQTAGAVNEEGWFSTGDIARIDEDGKLFIIDRVKNFFKLAQGEYVTPEKVENQYLSANSILTQCYTHGDSLRNFLVGIVGVDQIAVTKFLTDSGVSKAELQTDDQILTKINQPQHRTALLKSMNKNMTNLQGFEKLHNIYIEFEPLTLDRNVVTPTMKLKRPIAQKFFADQIKSMYDEGSLVKGNKL